MQNLLKNSISGMKRSSTKKRERSERARTRAFVNINKNPTKFFF